ncbi:PLD nuclease N-terminal domain-containing protein [Arthrobacter zhangbolii]|uniref:PLD nuclease N-terminal domain-containing protein n=1 Tax=Arthrobacter zhangbolii TaxID=2886936 RepID=A0A9X1M7J7_9MICC|nr:MULTISPECIES: PLDc N-terminal domain-containing protein [Arthrobacter]MCC3271987.1 PLD nuclease N-terminal domain-containing protein [Arthrobacter zhangbolii]MCC3294531.1 PLD nuclease N-terminal domain-containing protein [Arthrobacter zhangbolii]MDN3903046.1 PLDc N-terminal domain-containing protein [Arthrobacter sp. YD2]UON92129.1 PLD nuclease N-terminal domain-containing protein [Arthrobacter zhangbolii]
MAKKKFKDLSTGQKRGLGVLTGLQFLLAGAALRDIRRRPATLIRGSRTLWMLACGINFAGPIAYFLFGRRTA